MQRTDDVKAVNAVVQTYITGTERSDADLLRSVFHETAMLAGYLGPDVLVGSPEPFLQAIAERIVEPEYSAEITETHVIGRMATATIVEDNLYGLSFVTTFHLLNIEGKWIIISKLFHHD